MISAKDQIGEMGRTFSPMKQAFPLQALVILGFVCVEALSQDLEFAVDPWEVRISTSQVGPTSDRQEMFRQDERWLTSDPALMDWVVVAHEDQHVPSRMWGAGISIEAATPEERAIQAWEWGLSNFGWDPSQIGETTVAKGSKHERVFAKQLLDGLPVIGSKLQAKFSGEKLVMVGSDWWPNLTAVSWGDGVSQSAILAEIEADMGVGSESNNSGTTGIAEFDWVDLGMAWYPVAEFSEDGVQWNAHPVWQLEITGRRGVVPVRYETWVDMHEGEVIQRMNRVVYEAPADKVVHSMGAFNRGTKKAPNAALTTTAVSVFGQVKALAHQAYPYEPAEALGMPHLEIPLGAVSYFTDTAGLFTTDLSEDFLEVPLELRGTFATVYTDGVTPSVLVPILDGFNTLSAPGNPKEASAYRSTNLIHDHMREWLPEFSDLDWSMPVNIDVVGECNAFYDGSSINFFDEGGGCNPTSLIADVVHHEYGHAINDWYYQSLFYGFNNGAMNEGYADFWAMSLGDIAEIGKGFYTENNDGIRKYDEDPKVYPEDLVGEVHADGEIICGAWYDTHLLLGGDWATTMALFVDAYPGLQATVSNGQEGQAFTDVLLDVLQADDDDDDLLNGTPNAQAIIEGFAIHGITLFSYVDLDHTPVEFSAAESDVLIEAEAFIDFPYVVYFEAARLHYRTSPDDEFTVVDMDQNGSVFSYSVPGVPAGTVIEYYLDVLDAFGGSSAVHPFSANKAVNGNLPHYVLVGVEPVLINDLDEYSEFGYWDMDLPTDNATTGIWDEAIPVGSMGDVTDPNSVVAPLQDHSPGLYGFAYVTGLNPPLGEGIGANDVDGGHTTLLSPVIDLTPYQNPVLSYWRWYTNAPATGANPASDWWQVEVTNDGGNTWQYLENTSQQDISWRRKAFRISDVIEPSETFQIRFVASDSTTLGEYLDGGSLVEAAVDDIVLYDLASTEGVDSEPQPEVMAMPNPSTHSLGLVGWMPSSTVVVMDMKGHEIVRARANGAGALECNVSAWPSGTYVATGWNVGSRQDQIKFEVLH